MSTGLAGILWEAVFPENGEAVERFFPPLNRIPLLGHIAQGQVKQFHCGLFIRERAARFDHFAQSPIQRFHGIGGIDDFADLVRKRKEWCDLCPVAPPQSIDLFDNFDRVGNAARPEGISDAVDVIANIAGEHWVLCYCPLTRTTSFALELRVDALTESILAKAFRGELVPTEAELARAENRTYESAAQLLERIASLNTKSTGKPKRQPPQTESDSLAP